MRSGILTRVNAPVKPRPSFLEHLSPEGLIGGVSSLPCVVQSRACTHSITGAGGKSLPPVAAPHAYTSPRTAHSSPAWNNMASFSIGRCVVLQFTPDPWSVRITIAWCACTPPWSAKTCRGKFRVSACSCLKQGRSQPLVNGRACKAHQLDRGVCPPPRKILNL